MIDYEEYQEAWAEAAAEVERYDYEMRKKYGEPIDLDDPDEIADEMQLASEAEVDWLVSLIYEGDFFEWSDDGVYRYRI